MFQRTLMVFLGFVFLTLALTVGYAVAGLSGPETSIKEADRAIRAGRYSEAIHSLDLAERSLGRSDRALRERILRTRALALAHPDVGNYGQALEDLDRLRSSIGHPVLELENERIELLLRTGKGKEALQSARDLESKIETAKTDSRALELHGEAAQAVYQSLTSDLKSELRQNLPSSAYADALRALRRHLFREGDDASAERARKEFENVLREHDSTLLNAGRSRGLVRDIQLHVSEAQVAFRRALEVGGKPFAAYQGLTYALQQAGRDDDLIAASEIYLRRFDHRYAIAAAREAARMHEYRERPWSVVELVDRVLPLSSWQDRLRRDALHPSLGPLLAHQARALHTLGETTSLEKLVVNGYQLANQGVQLSPQLQLMHSFLNERTKPPEKDALPIIEAYCYSREVEKDHDDEHDAFIEGLRLWLRMHLAYGSSPDKLAPVLRIWSDNRPNDPEPYRFRARLHLERGEGQLALAHAQNAFLRDGRNEDLLHLCCEAAAMFHDSQQHGPQAMLQQCIVRNTELPTDMPDELLYLPLAELALQRKQPKIALMCARRALGLYAWAEWPRLLRADAAIACGEPAEAARTMEALLETKPYHPGALHRLRKAREAMGMSGTEQLFGAMFDPALDLDFAARLTRGALDRNEPVLLPGLVRCLNESFPLEASSMLLVAEAMERAGRDDQAKLLLTRVPELFPNDQKVTALASRRFLMLCARRGYEAEMASALVATRQLCSGDVAALTETANELVKLDRLEAAFQIMSDVVSADVPSGARTGAHFLLAGRVALATGRHAAAEEYLTAALSFKNGERATRLLVPLLLAQGRRQDAENAWWRETVDDLPSALMAVRLGRTKEAQAWLIERRRKEPTDLVLACALIATDANNADLRAALPEISKLDAPSRDAMVDALLFPEIRGLEKAGSARAAELMARFPDSATTRWLWARAEAKTGQVQRAVDKLLEIAKDQPDFIAASDELAGIAVHATDPKLDRRVIVRQVVHAVQRFRDLATPRMLALAARDVAAQIMRESGVEGPALNVLARVWIDHPEASGAGFQEVETLIAARRYEDAIALLDALEKFAPAHERSRFLDFWFRCAVTIVQGHPSIDLGNRLAERSRSIVQNEAPYGCALHFMRLVDAAEAMRKPKLTGIAAEQKKEEDRQLLLRHLELFESGRDPAIPSAIASLRALEQLDGPDAALVRSEALLKHDPGIVALWTLHAELLERADRAVDAAKLLQQIWRYTREPATMVQATRVTCEQGLPITDAVRNLELGVPAPMLDSPSGRYARGLLALRLARYTQAESLLANAEPQAQGQHLWFRALANLSIPGPEAAVRAEGLLRELASKFPKSTWAKNAGHFAAQLALKE